MQSPKKLAQKILKEYPEVFEELLKYEKTGKVSTKERANFTIDKTLLNRFRKYCKTKGYKMSSLIENFIMETLKKK